MPRKKNKPVFFRDGSACFSAVGVEVVEDGSTDARVIDHSIERRYGDNGIHVAVVREERADIPERHGCVVASVIPRQQETTEASESRMLQDVVYAVVDA